MNLIPRSYPSVPPIPFGAIRGNPPVPPGPPPIPAPPPPLIPIPVPPPRPVPFGPLPRPVPVPPGPPGPTPPGPPSPTPPGPPSPTDPPSPSDPPSPVPTPGENRLPPYVNTDTGKLDVQKFIEIQTSREKGEWRMPRTVWQTLGKSIGIPANKSTQHIINGILRAKTPGAVEIKQGLVSGRFILEESEYIQAIITKYNVSPKKERRKAKK